MCSEHAKHEILHWLQLNRGTWIWIFFRYDFQWCILPQCWFWTVITSYQNSFHPHKLDNTTFLLNFVGQYKTHSWSRIQFCCFEKWKCFLQVLLTWLADLTLQPFTLWNYIFFHPPLFHLLQLEFSSLAKLFSFVWLLHVYVIHKS